MSSFAVSFRCAVFCTLGALCGAPLSGSSLPGTLHFALLYPYANRAVLRMHTACGPLVHHRVRESPCCGMVAVATHVYLAAAQSCRAASLHCIAPCAESGDSTRTSFIHLHFVTVCSLLSSQSLEFHPMLALAARHADAVTTPTTQLTLCKCVAAMRFKPGDHYYCILEPLIWSCDCPRLADLPRARRTSNRHCALPHHRGAMAAAPWH